MQCPILKDFIGQYATIPLQPLNPQSQRTVARIEGIQLDADLILFVTHSSDTPQIYKEIFTLRLSAFLDQWRRGTVLINRTPEMPMEAKFANN